VHSGSMPAIVFSEYRTAQQWRYDYLFKEMTDRYSRFEAALENMERRLDALERTMYAYESQRYPVSTGREHKQPGGSDWYPGE